jgi:hypothetical protein
MRRLVIAVMFAALAAPAAAQRGVDDEYGRFELMAPDSNSYRIVYDISVTTAGAKSFVSRMGQVAQMRDISVTDRMTGQPLRFDRATNELRIQLARAVPAGGETRLRIAVTYHDPRIYYQQGGLIVFSMPFDGPRNAIVLPAGYELIQSDVPVQVIEEADGRLAASFMNTFPDRANVVMKGRPLAARPSPVPATGAAPTPPIADAPGREQPMNQIRVAERAFQDREIVYFLKEPDTHAFSLYHVYTASREGEHQYVNVVRAGSSVSEPSARILDTGEVLKTRTLTGADVVREKIDIPDRVEPDTQLVLIPFAPVKKGESVRLRISETYTDPARYALVDGQLMWHRSFGRPRNDMVLPAGWYLTTTSIPAVITLESDGRIRLSYWNPRPDSIDVFVKGRRR